MSTIRNVVVLSILSRIFVYCLALTTSSLPLFDASPKLFEYSWLSKPFLRWDTFHFAGIAQQGYAYEHQWAFFPGVPLVMRYANKVLYFLTGHSDLMLSGALVAMICDTTRTMYSLSLHHLRSPKLAYLATLLSLFPSNPATLRLTAYTEPFFTYFSYKGMWYCTQSEYLYASLFFMTAGLFRSNGTFLGGFILWDLVAQPLLFTGKIYPRRILRSILLTAVTFIPFVYQQYTGYLAFCTGHSKAEWCKKTLPLIYSHVQDKYWNVGFLRYWTLSQIPNFLIAAPPLLSIVSFSFFVLLSQRREDKSNSPFTHPSLVPHAIHALVLCAILILASHVQVVLRLAASMPLTYWAAAWLVLEHPKAGMWWVSWSVVWGTISVVLWATFLPPA
ncbi:glycosyltransferase family 76 protein [Moniliophthora roreri MCA 2997]|uniref:GPI mannosyltransferase 2 n=2 Tax=Moniliophthora roreri TaxID=221103 RepID=V2X1D4_MONRO|nr:glycosyltransferase family 76 protein [Moniliophthora roreri MCA 2997]